MNQRRVLEVARLRAWNEADVHVTKISDPLHRLRQVVHVEVATTELRGLPCRVPHADGTSHLQIAVPHADGDVLRSLWDERAHHPAKQEACGHVRQTREAQRVDLIAR